MTDERVNNYNEHAKFMADIALCILNGDKNIIDINGVKEIIALYLLIPYITPDVLTTPDDMCKIPKITGDFCGGISLEDLRNTICHSFVTTEEDNNDGTIHGKTIIFDDRVIYHNRKAHADLGPHSTAYKILTHEVHNKLVELFSLIKKQ